VPHQFRLFPVGKGDDGTWYLWPQGGLHNVSVQLQPNNSFSSLAEESPMQQSRSNTHLSSYFPVLNHKVGWQK